MPVTGQPRSFHKKFKFVVFIDGFGSAAFAKCSELSVEAAEVAYYEGGAIIPDKSPGRLTFADITLERGATLDRDCFDWFAEVANFAAQTGEVDPNYKRNVEIVQLDRDGSVLRKWRITGAWPKKFVAGEWDNGADENTMESVTLAIDLFELVQ